MILVRVSATMMTRHRYSIRLDAPRGSGPAMPLAGLSKNPTSSSAKMTRKMKRRNHGLCEMRNHLKMYLSRLVGGREATDRDLVWMASLISTATHSYRNSASPSSSTIRSSTISSSPSFTSLSSSSRRPSAFKSSLSVFTSLIALNLGGEGKKREENQRWILCLDLFIYFIYE